MKINGLQIVGRRRRRGSALIVVFWLLAVLTFAVFTTMQLVSSDVEMIVSQKKSFKALQLCEMGIAIGANPEVQRYDPILFQYDEVSEEGFRVVLRGEGGRLNINTLLLNQGEGRELLRRMFDVWGVEEDLIDEIIDALIDWVDEDDLKGLNGAEFEYYEELGFRNRPFNRPFYDIEEMALVKGIDLLSQSQPEWRSYFTLYSGGKLDLADASQNMLVSMGVNELDAESFIEDRRGPDQIDFTEDDRQYASVEEALALLPAAQSDPLIANWLSMNDGTVRIESTGMVGDYKKQIVMILRDRGANAEILSREISYLQE